jgi:hypothetical protein
MESFANWVGRPVRPNKCSISGSTLGSAQLQPVCNWPELYAEKVRNFSLFSMSTNFALSQLIRSPRDSASKRSGESLWLKHDRLRTIPFLSHCRGCLHARACQALKGRRPTRCHRLGTRQDAAQLHLARGFWPRLPMGGLAARVVTTL